MLTHLMSGCLTTTKLNVVDCIKKAEECVYLHNNTQEFINTNYDSDLFPVITKPTRITHTSATLIDNIFLDSLLTGNITNRILIDDISNHLPTVTILENLNHSVKKKVKITSRDTRLK